MAKDPTVYDELEAIRENEELGGGIGKAEFVSLLDTTLSSYNKTKEATKGKNFWSRIALYYMRSDKGLKILRRFKRERKQADS